jgi:hypothetical protein
MSSCDYRCHDMSRTCNHAGHIDELEKLDDTHVARIRELEAEVAELRKAKLWVPNAEDLRSRAEEARLSKASVNGDPEAAIAFLKALAAARQRGRPLACIGDCDKSHALQHELNQVKQR